MENCSTKTEMLREKYKEYLKPIDPLQPLGRDPTELMPPPDRIVQTCFSLKEKFPRGELIVRTFGKRSVLDKLDEYNQLKIPAQCPCENVVQGSDPARKKRRLSSTLTRSERSKIAQQHIICSVTNLPQANTFRKSDISPPTKDIPNQGNTRAKLRTSTTMWDIKKDKDMNEQAITSQRKLIRAKAVEIQQKSLALQQTSKKAEMKKSCTHITDENLWVRSKPTAPRNPAVPPKQRRPTIPMPLDDMAIPAEQLQNALLAGSSPSYHACQPKAALSTPATSSASCTAQPVEAFNNVLMNAITAKRTPPCRPDVPAMEKLKSPIHPKTLAGYHMPSLADPQEMSRPTSPATSMNNASNEICDINESSVGDMEISFYPDPPQPNVDTPELISPGSSKILENQGKCEPMAISGDIWRSMSSSLQQANLPMEEQLPIKKSNSFYKSPSIAAGSIRKVTPAKGLHSMTESDSMKTIDSFLGIVSKPTNPRKPAVPPRKPLAKPVQTDSLVGIISKPTNPRRPTVPPRKQLSAAQAVSSVIALPTQKPGHPKNTVVKAGMSLQNCMPTVAWFN